MRYMKMGGVSMGCMKCGRDVSFGQVFCDKCLEEMEKYPVKPGTVVRLPRRVEESVFRKPHPRRRPQLTPDEQIKKLKLLLRRLIVTVMILLMLLGVTGYFAVVHLLESEIVRLPGQNYSSVTAEEPTEAE